MPNKHVQFNLKSYLERDLSNSSVVKTIRNDLKRKKEHIEKSILSEFLENEDHFMNVVVHSKKIENIKKEIKICLFEYRKKLFNLNVNSKQNLLLIDNEKIEELKYIFDNFNDDMQMFLTANRYFLNAWNVEKVSQNERSMKIKIIFSNDLIFFAKEEKKGYTLLKVFSYDTVDFFEEDDYLIFRKNSIEFKITASSDILEQINTLWQEKTSGSNFDNQNIERRSEEIFKCHYKINTNRYNQSNFDTFHIRTSQDFENIRQNTFLVEKFILNRLNFHINNINLLNLSLINTIDRIFDLHSNFVSEQNQYLSDDSFLPLLLEKQFKQILCSLQKRIFYKRRKLTDLNTILKILQKKLTFPGYNYTYLLESWNENIKNLEQLRLQMAKTSIHSIINEPDIEN